MGSSALPWMAVVLGTTATIAYVNHHLVGLPRHSGLLIIGFCLSVVVVAADHLLPSAGLAHLLRQQLAGTDFPSLLFNGALAFLLFAGAVQMDVRGLLERKWTIVALATVGVILSTALTAGAVWGVFKVVGLDVPFAYCLVFGALISPTDPVMVLGVLDRIGVPTPLKNIIAGESVFNDGVGIVLFMVFLGVASGGGELALPFGAMLVDFVRELLGGAALGLTTGGIAFLAMRGIDEYNIELMISLTLVAGTYALAQSTGVSGPVAVVVAGLVMGSVGVRYAVSGTTKDYLHKFWSLTDDVLNSLLFLFIGLEVAVLRLTVPYILAAGLAIPVILAVRFVSVAVPGLPINLQAPEKMRAVSLLTWSGLRGGISVALALSLPQSPYRDALVTMCYGVVLFTMVVQGLSLKWVASRLYPEPQSGAAGETGRRAAA